MSGLIQEVHREIPDATRAIAKSFLERRERVRRSARIAESINRDRNRRQQHQSVIPEDPRISAIRSELQARINACFNGNCSDDDRTYIAEHALTFEKPLPDGSGQFTVIDFE